MGRRLPARLTVIQRVLPLKPGIQGLEILDQWLGVQMVLAGHSFQGNLPGLRGPRFEHSLQFGSGSFRAKKAAPVQRSFVASGFAHGLVELELVDSRQIIPGVGNVGGDVGFGAGVEVGLGARDGWGHPPGSVPEAPTTFCCSQGAWSARRILAIATCRSEGRRGGRPPYQEPRGVGAGCRPRGAGWCRSGGVA